jgi:acyl-[acyl-carrier-protein]-phospholipid O-acyltransferase/long-chain-fatty-acid--[acyl-carrier-protein] ligase
MADRTLETLASRRFLPLFVTQFLGAFNDNLFKNAIAILILYRIFDQAGANGQILVTIGTGLFILPFFLFSATAGQLADKFAKPRLIRAVKLCEIVVMALAALGFALGNAYFLMGVLFLMGSQSAFFSPLKYGLLPEHLSEQELVGANALLEAGTFLAILLGTIAGGLLILAEGGTAIVSAMLLVLALAGWAASLFIPPAKPATPDLRVNWNLYIETRDILLHAAERREVLLSILGISWFWLVGATFLAQFPAFAKEVLGGNQEVVTLLLTVFSLGIGAGSMLCDRLLKGEITARYVPLGALGMALFSVDLYLASGSVGASGPLLGAAAFLAAPENWRMLADLFLIAACGGLYIVPLYAILQSRAEAAWRARIIAGNNIINALFMVAGAVFFAGLLAIGFTVTDIFLVIALANVLAAVYICKLLPHELLKALASWVFRLAYRVEVKGWENYAKVGDKAVVVVNHVSFLDGPLLAAFLPGRPMFAIDTHMASRWWARPFLALIEAFPMDPTRPLSTKALIRQVQSGKHCVIFPEGRITVTGALMKVYEGPGMIADKADAQVLPVRIDGAQYTHFSRLKGKLRLRFFPKITITILEPRRFTVPAELRGRRRRQRIGNALYQVMSDMMFETHNAARRSLFQALLEARHIHGGGKPVVEDIERKPLTYGRLALGSLVLGRRVAAMTERRETVGLLLPNAGATVASFFALQAFGRVPAMLNFTAGAANLISACRTAKIRSVFTSRRFVEQAKLQDAAAALAEQVRLVYLEDLKGEIGLMDKLYGLAARPFAGWLHRRLAVVPAEPALVLFTSGSEGSPKGVVLSHDNILSNCHQLAARIDFNPNDIVFNALPVFHSFGLTGGMLLPIFSGIKTFMYPSPLHYRIVPELVYGTNATVMFGTDTFLAGYARMAHPYDFYSLRYLFAGAEKLRDETRRAWMEKFGIRILEGYGATECAPVIAVNSPMHAKAGTVGRLLPGIAHRLEPVPGVETGGRLVVAGPNVMLGYLRTERPGVLEPPAEGSGGPWYDTGDIVEIDQDGFVTIVGRAKRFAKIAGEMVSLGAVEDLVSGLWPDNQHAVVNLPDARKGEQLVLVTDRFEAARDELSAYARRQGATELMVPKVLLPVEQVPLLGTGKTDYVGAKALAERLLTGDTAA